MTGSPHDAHLAAAPEAVRPRLAAIQAEVERRVPEAERCTGYAMPAYRRGKIFLYFAAFKKHIGVYPPLHAPADLVAELAPYRGPNGNLVFPHDRTFPLDLIGRTAAALAAQYAPLASGEDSRSPRA
ncbi:MAG: DUF1801 domain-containing protein [Rhodobacteraceae bacterium]|nr:DUF1801 domain-containing protein [Paracoccaceae bacterium]